MGDDVPRGHMPRVPKGHSTRRGIYPERHPLKVPKETTGAARTGEGRVHTQWAISGTQKTWDRPEGSWLERAW